MLNLEVNLEVEPCKNHVLSNIYDLLVAITS